MKVLVPVKRVIGYNVNIRVKADGTGVDRREASHRQWHGRHRTDAVGPPGLVADLFDAVPELIEKLG